jgi:hypothetical protein
MRLVDASLSDDISSSELWTMLREPIESSVIASMGYQADQRILEIEFRTGDIYTYFDVPAEEYIAFRSAESKGTYLNSVFKPRGYRYLQIK